MAVAPEKEKAIELAVSSIEKAFGKGSIMRLGNEEALVKDVQAVSTGSVSLDIALGVGEELALGGSRELLEALVRDRGGEPFVLLLGYAGWAPLQAENEIAAGAWVPMPLESDLVFDVPLEKRWEVAVRRLGLDPGEFLVGTGGARA